jgi:hypothetical protein
MSAPKPALEEWIPKSAAAKLLGVSLRQIERREKDGFLEKRTLPRLATESTGRVVYSRADLLALKAGTPNTHARAVQDIVDPEASPLQPVVSNGGAGGGGGSNGKSTALALVRNTPASGPPAAFWQALYNAATATPPAPKPWLTVDEAVEYSGLPRGYLLKRAREGWDAAVDVSTGGAHQFWRFNRAALGAGK